MPSLSRIKQRLSSSDALFATYSTLTKPFAKSLRHLGTPPSIPANPEKVSVAIPNYNYKDFLKARAKSILNQTYPLYELIILDDASTDGSGQYIEQELLPIIRTKNPDLKVKFIKNSKNSGKSIFQWQKAFKEATGDFLWLAEADDLSDPNFLATVMSKFSSQNVVLSFANSAAINPRGAFMTYDFANRSVDKLKSGRFKSDFIVDGKKIITKEFAINCIIPNVSSCVFRLDSKIPYQKYLSSALDFVQCGDWYFYLKVLEHGKLAYSRAALNLFRIHPNSVTAATKKTKTILLEVKKIHALIAEEYSLAPDIKLAMEREASRIANRLVV